MNQAYYISIVTLLFIVTSCLKSKTLKNEPQFEISDLNFGDNYKNVLKANDIAKTYLIATGVALKYTGIDTVFSVNYDMHGNIVREVRHGGFSKRTTYQYDSFHLIKNKTVSTDFTADFETSYQFLPDSLRLYQFWYNRNLDTNIYYFNNLGLLIESIEWSHDDGNGSKYKTTYLYDSLKRLTLKTWESIISGHDPTKTEETRYYYTNNNLRLDSSEIKSTSLGNSKLTTSSKTYYDINGLKNRTIYNDSISMIYLHTKRRQQ